jgi:hypothetical protein
MKMKLVNHNGIDALRDKLIPLFDKCVAKAFHGETTTNDIISLVAEGKALLAVCFDDDGEIELVAALEPADFPQFRAINIFALAGKSAGAMARFGENGFMDLLKQWAIEQGFNAIDACTSPGMEKIVRRFGFQRLYIYNRLTL